MADQDRDYPSAARLSHVVGYLGQPDQSDLDAGRSAVEAVGRAGLEQAYDDVLSGTPGRREIRVDAIGSMGHEEALHRARERRAVDAPPRGALEAWRSQQTATRGFAPKCHGFVPLPALPSAPSTLR